MYYPRILIISNNCLSKSDSNGRTLGNFVSLWPRDSIAQFCIHDQDKDWDICANFYAISDMQAVKALLLGKKIDGRRIFSEDEITKKINTSGKRTVSRTPASMLLRNAAWASMRWKNEMFNAWVNDFKPEVVILQAGDLPAFYDIAVRIAKERRIPLVIYNSEEYYFKDYCYFGEDASFKWLYPIFHNKLKKSVRRALNYAAGSIYISDYLKELYDEEFGKRSITLMTSATEDARSNTIADEGKSQAIIYGGNLGVGRHKALIDIGNALQKIDPALKIDVYGKCDDPEIAQELNSCSGINYAGMIPYGELQKRTKAARLLVHVESMKPYYVRDIKYGFSTKIADSLASGVPFFVYASSELTSVQYLRENKCAIIAADEKQLVDKLKCALFDEQARNLCVANARKIAVMNHNQEKNKEGFYEYVIGSLTNENKRGRNKA